LTQFSLGGGLVDLVLDGTELDRTGFLRHNIDTGHAFPVRSISARLESFLPFRCLQCPAVAGVDQAVTTKISPCVKVPILLRRRRLAHHDHWRAGHLVLVKVRFYCDVGARIDGIPSVFRRIFRKFGQMQIVRLR
jgi:hypothetical protein